MDRKNEPTHPIVDTPDRPGVNPPQRPGRPDQGLPRPGGGGAHPDQSLSETPETTPPVEPVEPAPTTPPKVS